ncbi:MAG: hypothetical protein P4L53_25130 [Candidatus Obscuribacterales bacterium]|nr:hypothetical protein [Candidatus Obscuribacterales bacterium]
MPTAQMDPLIDMLRTARRDVTPIRLRLLLVIIIGLTLIFCMFTINTIHQHTVAVQSIGSDAAPSVIAAHQIEIGVQAMDADLTGELLQPVSSRLGQQFAHDYEKWRVLVGKELIAAARNITYGDIEAESVENLQTNFGLYTTQAQMARDAHQVNADDAALRNYRASLKTLQQSLIPEAEKLNRTNGDILETVFHQEESESSLSGGFVLVLGIMLTALLGACQIYLSKRFRRRFNIPLLFATMTLIGFVQHLYPALQENTGHLKIAKDDSYDSIAALMNARADAYDANACQSRWLLDRQNTESIEKSFSTAVGKIASFGPENDYSKTVEKVEKQIKDGAKVNVPGFGGALADALANLRFAGESQAAFDMLKAFGAYQTADQSMKRYEKSGDHKTAIELGLGYDPDATKYAFNKFDDALLRTLAINKEQFDRAIKDATSDVHGLTISCLLVAFLIIVCTYWGLRDRLAEYAG